MITKNKKILDTLKKALIATAVLRTKISLSHTPYIYPPEWGIFHTITNVDYTFGGLRYRG